MEVAILTEFTPNPNAMKFILNMDVRTTGKVTVRSPEQAKGVPLIEHLFELSYVEQVHVFENVITVTKAPDAPWEEALEDVKAVISAAVDEHDPDFPTPGANSGRSREALSPEIRAIEEVLDRTVRPYLQGDGGDLDVIAYEDKRVVVDYQGACGTCPSSISGTLQAIQGILRDEVDPEIEVISATY